MRNPATESQDEPNIFTQYVIDNPGTKVVLRDGMVVAPEWNPAQDETCEDCFMADNWKYCWNVDGTSVKNYTLDMMEIKDND